MPLITAYRRRERVIAVSIRKDIDRGFTFPKPIPLRLKLLDLLESNVDEKYYIPNANIEYSDELSSERESRTTVLISKQGEHIEKGSDTAITLLARDYKGVGNQPMNGVLEYEL